MAIVHSHAGHVTIFSRLFCLLSTQKTTLPKWAHALPFIQKWIITSLRIKQDIKSVFFFQYDKLLSSWNHLNFIENLCPGFSKLHFPFKGREKNAMCTLTSSRQNLITSFLVHLIQKKGWGDSQRESLKLVDLHQWFTGKERNHKFSH